MKRMGGEPAPKAARHATDQQVHNLACKSAVMTGITPALMLRIYAFDPEIIAWAAVSGGRYQRLGRFAPPAPSTRPAL